MKKEKKMNKKALMITAAVLLFVLLICGAVLCIIHFGKNGGASDNTDPDKIEKNEPIAFDAIDIGEGIKLVTIASASGTFPEDGKNENVENVLLAEFENTSDKTVQYAKVNVAVGDEIYSFEFSTLPPASSLYAFEMNKKSAEGIEGDISCKTDYLLFFENEPSLMDQYIDVTVSNGYINIKNISGVDLDRGISVFYKNVSNGAYMGGITYRVRIDGIKAGETVSGYSSHALEGVSKVMFCQYDS